jgi:hypothetical protein
VAPAPAPAPATAPELAKLEASTAVPAAPPAEAAASSELRDAVGVGLGRADERQASPASGSAPAPASSDQPAARYDSVRGFSATNQQVQVRGGVGLPLAAAWRITAVGRLERSIDGGATWQEQSVEVARVTALSAPGGRVAWLVGPGGAVLRTTDGETWERRPFPEDVSLTDVRADGDGNTATVAAADGRSFRTTDGGATWGVVPPQEF